MTREQILIELKYLPIEDKLSVLATLNQMIKIEEKESLYREMVDKYVGTMKKFAGDNFLIGRRRKNVQAKVVLAICLMEDGHSLILRYPKMYSDVIKLYNNFKEAL